MFADRQSKHNQQLSLPLSPTPYLLNLVITAMVTTVNVRIRLEDEVEDDDDRKPSSTVTVKTDEVVNSKKLSDENSPD